MTNCGGGEQRDDCAHEWTTWRMTQHSDYRGRAMRERHCLRCGAYQTMRVESWLTVAKEGEHE